MVIDNTFHSEYSTIAGKLDYEIGFEYFTNPDNTPQLRVQLNGNDLSYGVDYTLSGDGLSIVLDSDPGLDGALIIRRSVPFTQTSDYTVGRIDPEQIEKDFDLMVMRDQEIADYFDWLAGNTFDFIDYAVNIFDSFGDIVTHNVSDFVQKSGDTMGGPLGFERNGTTVTLKMDNVLGYNAMRIGSTTEGFALATGGQDSLFPVSVSGKLGLAERPWATAYISKLNNGGNIVIPSSAGTMALLSDLPTTAADVHALPDTTKYGASLVATIDPLTFVMTLTLKDQDGYTLGSSQTIDLPLESVVVSGTYDSATKEVVLTLESGSTIRFSVADLVSGLQTEITSLNMLDADLVDDSTSTNKFVTAAEKTAISTAVQPADLNNYVAKAGDTMTGALKLVDGSNNGGYLKPESGTISFGWVANGVENKSFSINNSGYIEPATNNNGCLGTSAKKWYNVYTGLINNGADITVPSSGGTMALTSDIPDVSHMVTDNTAQSISAVKTFTAANPDSTTLQTIVANYAIKLGTSSNDDLFAISANTGTNTLNIVGDNANNIICIAASGAVLNKLEVTQSDVTFGGVSLKNPGNMVGADGVNAGTSGLVPAPAATDNVNFLCGDGTWKAAGGGLPSQTGQSGKFLTTDGTDASWSDKPLVNNATGTNSIAVGNSSVATGVLSIAIGRSATTSSASSSVAIGDQTQSTAYGSIAIGSGARVTNNSGISIGTNCRTNAANAIQIGGDGFGGTKTNSDANTFKVANANGNFEIMSADGTVPTARLTKVNTTATLAAADWVGGSQTVSVTGMTATGIVFVNPDPSDQADYTSAGILCTAQAAGTLTFTCDTTPSNDIDVVVVMM